MYCNCGGEVCASTKVCEQKSCDNIGGVPNQRTVNDRSLEALEKGQNKVLDVLRRLEKKVDQLQERTFDIKSAHLEAPLTPALGHYYCRSLERNLTDADIKNAIQRTTQTTSSQLFDPRSNAHHLEAARDWCRAKVVTMQQDERRKVLGKRPYERWATYSTDHLAQGMGRAWGVSITSVSAYKPHLALLRKFSHETVQPEADFYPRFRVWLEGYDYCSPLTEQQSEMRPTVTIHIHLVQDHLL